MVSRNRNHAPIPDTLASVECRDNLSEIIGDIISGDTERIKAGKAKISDSYYRGKKVADGKIIQDVVIALKAIYGEKCAFCESNRFNPDVEHFRPKKGVVGLPKNEHYGYYWLCYEWTNLIPSCPDCNDAKGNHFPISQEGKRLYGPLYNNLNRLISTDEMLFTNPILLEEQPVLLHPGFDSNCEAYFTFNNKGEIQSVDQNGRGFTTREKLDLDRPDLRFYRKKEIDNFIEKFEMALYFPEDSMFIEVLDKLRYRGVNLNTEYTALCRYVYNNFEDLIVPLLPVPAQHRAENIYLNNRNRI